MSICALRRRHSERSGRRYPDGGGPHLSSRDAQSISRLFCLYGLLLFDCLVVTLALPVLVRASQHGHQVIRPRKRQGIHQGATNENCYARHYFRISAGISPCLLNMSLVAMARATTVPTSRDVKSSFGGGGATPNRHLAKPGISRSKARDGRAVV